MKFVLPFVAALALVACTPENAVEVTPVDPNAPGEENVPGPCGTSSEVGNDVNCQVP